MTIHAALMIRDTKPTSRFPALRAKSFFLLGIFLSCSVLGWIGDTAVRSFLAGEYLPGSFFPLPLCPIYGFAALFILAASPYVARLPHVGRAIAYGLLLGGFEFLSGTLIERLSGRRLWDYSSSFLNLNGYTDLFHAVVWSVLALLFLRATRPFLERAFPRA